MDEILNVLFHCPLFSGIEKPEIQNILRQTQSHVSNYKKNEYIFQLDRPSEYIGIVIHGSVEVQKISSSGKLLNLLSRNKGEVFGGAAIFSRKLSPNVNVISKESSKVLFIHKQSVIDILCKNNTIASNILDMSANNIAHLNQRIELLCISSIQKKIAFTLLFDMQPSELNLVKLPFSKKSWAEYLNVSRPSLCRELKCLCVEGVIEVKNKAIKIVDKQKLQLLLMD
jgi:CRP-like cAMP-binding protein